jgi:hypothetical protein
MKYLVTCIAGILALATAVSARLMPINFCDDPPIQRLTAAYTMDHWSTNAFGQCRGISLRPIDRMSSG